MLSYSDLQWSSHIRAAQATDEPDGQTETDFNPSSKDAPVVLSGACSQTRNRCSYCKKVKLLSKCQIAQIRKPLFP